MLQSPVLLTCFLIATADFPGESEGADSISDGDGDVKASDATTEALSSTWINAGKKEKIFTGFTAWRKSDMAQSSGLISKNMQINKQSS